MNDVAGENSYPFKCKTYDNLVMKKHTKFFQYHAIIHIRFRNLSL